MVDSADYSQEQIEAWAPSDLDEKVWHEKFNEIEPYVVIADDNIIAYADIQSNGYIDHFFCHHEYQRQGVGSFLFSHLEKTASKNGIAEMTADVSVTARPFFESKGFVVRKEQLLSIRGKQLINYKMVRSRDHCKQYM